MPRICHRFHSREEALAALPKRFTTWDVRSPNYVKPKRHKNRVLFGRVPPSFRWFAREKFDLLVARWHRNHPGSQMSQGKRASLIGNATHWALYVTNNHWKSIMNLRKRKRKQALQYLRDLDLAEFKAQPLSKRVKRLI